jgi:hypothetical protein
MIPWFLGRISDEFKKKQNAIFDGAVEEVRVYPYAIRDAVDCV